MIGEDEIMAPRTIGFIGTGTMGSRMAPHVASAGYPVHVFDIDTEAARRWRAPITASSSR